MLTTPLQLLGAYAAIANGGTLYTPQVVEEVTNPLGAALSGFTPNRGKLKASPET
jgi:penicillin-binding protein 2